MLIDLALSLSLHRMTQVPLADPGEGTWGNNGPGSII
jgi:hypothetical protein